MNLGSKKVLVTGADGFIGSHLVEALLDVGVDVKPFVYYNSFNSWGWLDTIDPDKLAGLDVFAGDVRDPNGVRTALDGCDAVFHLAALIGIPFSYHSPDSYVDTNVKGTLNILQAARNLELERVVVTSTSEVYGTAQYVPIDEKHPLQGQSPYSASKIGADKMAESFHLSFELPVTTVRPFNTYGPRQSERAVIPTIIGQLLRGSDAIELGALTPTRDLTYVTDTAKGFIALAESDEAIGQAVNLGVGEEISIGDLADKLISIVGSDVAVTSTEERARPSGSEVQRLLSDNSLARKLTPWKPEVSLDEGLSLTVDWFRELGATEDKGFVI